MQSRMDQIEANEDELMTPETAKRFVLSIGIMEEAEWDAQTQTEKGKVKNTEEANKASEIVKKLAQEKKQRDKRLQKAKESEEQYSTKESRRDHSQASKVVDEKKTAYSRFKHS